MVRHYNRTMNLSESRLPDPRLGPDLLWRDVRSPRCEKPRSALFVDRDGVLIEEKFYLHNPADLNLLPGAGELLKTCRDRNIPVIVVTNQAGIARGKFSWADFAAVEQRLAELLAADGLQVDAVFACPFHEHGQGEYRVENHPWRKPNPGMLIEAARLLNLNLAQSLMIGDKASDIAAAEAAGLPEAIHVLTGHGPEHRESSLVLNSPAFRVHSIPDLDFRHACLAASVKRLEERQ